MSTQAHNLSPRRRRWIHIRHVLIFTGLSLGLLSGCVEPIDEPKELVEPTSFDSTFAALQSKLFEGKGCTNAACHGEAAAGGLDLRADVSYDQLVEVPSTGSSLPRVEIGDRSRSYLYLKLLAATEPESAEIGGSPMPVGSPAIPANLLEALRLWIYAGAPRTGSVFGTEELLGTKLPDAEPFTIAPLPAPAVDEGFQLELPPWTIPAGGEREVCFASYFDVRDTVPDSMKDETGDYAYIRAEQLRQDPQSHHLILSRSPVPAEDIHEPVFGAWTCRGGEKIGETCEPTDLSSCGTGHCSTAPTDGFACIGYGPAVPGAGLGGGRIGMGGAQKAQDYDELPAGVYRKVPLHGILYWNSHAFNVTTKDHLMNGRINLLFATDRQYKQKSLGGVFSIFKPKTPPFEKEEVCSTVSVPKGAHLFSLSSHTHKRGERFTIFHPDGTLIYENLIYNDPIRKRFDPPIVFNSDVKEERTLTYCAVYNNGVDEDGAPDPETVTRFSRMPESTKVPGVPGTCSPKACVTGLVGESCSGVDDNATCDSASGAGDGWCDACAITGGESTENEMFLVLGKYYVMDEAN